MGNSVSILEMDGVIYACQSAIFARAQTTYFD